VRPHVCHLTLPASEYEYLGHVFENMDGEIYPMVGLRTPGEAIRANFGQQPFKYDIESYAHLQRNVVWSKIQSLPITWSSRALAFQTANDETESMAISDTRKNEDETHEAMGGIIMDYLSHHGYAATAEAFRLALVARSSASESNAAALASSTNSMDVTMPSSESKQLAISSAADILARQRITAALTSGDVDYVLETMSDRYPDALAANGGWLLFRLRCRKFVELVLEAAAALKIARKVEAAEVASRDKGKAPSVPTPPPTASVPIRRAPTHHMHPSFVFEEEEDDDLRGNGNMMDVDEEDEDAVDHRAVQEQLVHTPSSSPIPTSHFSTPTTKNTQYTNTRTTSAPIAISRPLIPISTASSSPSSTPPKPSPISTFPAVASNGATSKGTTNPLLSVPTNTTPNPMITPLFPMPTTPQPRGLITAPPPPMSSAAQAALEHIFAYGRQLDADYGADERAHVQMLFHRTSSLVAYENPLEAGGDVSRLAGQEAREELAVAVNEGILGQLAFFCCLCLWVLFSFSRFVASQERNSRPVLERMYEQAAATVVHLGLTGTGAAAYADMERELLKEE
jgi:hypothetical protein